MNQGQEYTLASFSGVKVFMSTYFRNCGYQGSFGEWRQAPEEDHGTGPKAGITAITSDWSLHQDDQWHQIGILDIYGFERLQRNLEQEPRYRPGMCIYI
jgi:hypothetical protein